MLAAPWLICSRVLISLWMLLVSCCAECLCRRQLTKWWERRHHPRWLICVGQCVGAEQDRMLRAFSGGCTALPKTIPRAGWVGSGSCTPRCALVSLQRGRVSPAPLAAGVGRVVRSHPAPSWSADLLSQALDTFLCSQLMGLLFSAKCSEVTWCYLIPSRLARNLPSFQLTGKVLTSWADQV